MSKILRLFRLHHCVKNLLVLCPLFFGGYILESRHLLETRHFINGIMAFVVFSFVASAVYIFNDICDMESDRLHPKKRLRPIASGAISVKTAVSVAISLLVFAFACMAFSSSPLKLMFFAVVYIGINLAYSYRLKNYPVLDVIILASGFLLRLIFGSVATGVPISHWLGLTILMGAIYLGLGKRRNELKRMTTGFTRPVLRYYTIGYLDKHMYLCMGLSLMFYALWSITLKSVGMVWTVPLVLCIVMRYNLVIERESDGDPVEVLFGDKVLCVLSMLYMILMFTLLYCPKGASVLRHLISV